MKITIGACPTCKHSTCTVEIHTSSTTAEATCENEACLHRWTVEVKDNEEDYYQELWDSSKVESP